MNVGVFLLRIQEFRPIWSECQNEKMGINKEPKIPLRMHSILDGFVGGIPTLSDT